MPVSWNEGGYAALFVLESPDVRFEDIMVVEVSQKETLIPIDFKFIDVCEKGTIEVCSCIANEPVNIGAQIINDMLNIKLSKKVKKPIRLIIKLNGVRKGFRNTRFPNRTKQDFIANEKFLKQAYPK